MDGSITAPAPRVDAPADPRAAPARAEPVMPPVYVARGGPHRAAFSTRLTALLIASGCLAVLLTAAWLTPSPAGHGSHTGLGLDRCGFLAKTGLPCPSCGMTTSFAWFARGNLAAAVYVQPMGAALAFAAAACVWVGFYVALTGRPVHRLLWLVPSRYLLTTVFVLAVGGWAWKMFAHARGIGGW